MPTAELKQTPAPAKRLDVKQAARLALRYFADLYPGGLFTDVALEEVEMSEDERFWMITLGFNVPNPPPSVTALGKSIADVFGPPPPKLVRKFKVFKVDTHSGKVVSMRIRKLE